MKAWWAALPLGLLVGIPLVLTQRAGPDAPLEARAVDLDPELARYHPLASPAQATWDRPELGWSPYVIAWSNGNGFPLRMVRVVEGWEELDGVAYARVSHVLAHPKDRRCYAAEWIRPLTTPTPRLVVGQRAVADLIFRVEPPQPILVTPLEVGARWSWEGKVGGAPASAEFEVVELGSYRGWDDVLIVAQTTRMGGRESTQRLHYAAGYGFVGEEGRFPIEEPGRASDGMRAWIPDRD